MDVLATTDGGATFTVAPLPGDTDDVTKADLDAVVADYMAKFAALPVPEVTQAELDALTSLVNSQEAADQARDTQQSADIAADTTRDDQQAIDIQNLANQIGSGSPSANPENAIYLDSLAGSTDDAKLDAALTIAQASSPRRPIRLSARNYTFNKTRTTFSGLRIFGPNVGWQNPEIGGTNGALPQCNVTLNCGTGSSAWLVGTATTYDVAVAGITFKSSNGNTQFYHHPYSAGTAYATRLHELSFYGFKHVLGMPGNAFAMTLNTISGTWSCVGVLGTQFSLRGSDNFLWCSGEINYGWWGENGGQYLVRFENLMKTAVKHMYLTARDGARAILVDGPGVANQGGLDISDCVVEGNNKDQPSYGALIVVTGGGVSFTNIKLNFGMVNPSKFTDRLDTGLVMVLGGIALLTNFWLNKATAWTEGPVVSVAGGTAYVSRFIGMAGGSSAWASLPLAQRTAGTLFADTSVRTA